MARGIKFGAREAYAVVGTLPNGENANQAAGLYTYKRHASAAKTRAERGERWKDEANRVTFDVVPVVLTWHLEAAE